MAPFEFVVPTTLPEAIALLDPDDPGVRPVGGATAVMLMMKAGVLQLTRMVSLRRLEATHSEVSVDADGHLAIGGFATLSSLEHSPLVQQGWPVLTRTFKTLSNIRVRNVATLGGNLAHGDPHMDMPPVLSALNASVVLTGPTGERIVKVEDLYTGYYETVVRRDELITRIVVPPQARQHAAYMKVTTRAAHDWPALGVAVVLDMAGESIRDASLIVGAATDRPTRLTDAEALLRGQSLTDDLLRAAGDSAARQLDIVGDAHGSAAYKKQLLRVYLGRAVRKAIAASDSKEHA